MLITIIIGTSSFESFPLCVLCFVPFLVMCASSCALVVVSSWICQLHLITQCSNSTCTCRSFKRNVTGTLPFLHYALNTSTYHLSPSVTTSISLWSTHFTFFCINSLANRLGYHNLHNQLLPPRHTLRTTNLIVLLYKLWLMNTLMQTLVAVQASDKVCRVWCCGWVW